MSCTYHKEAGGLWFRQSLVLRTHLMRSFFDRRFYRVKINGHKSEWKTMTRGCPQGTAFGPLLWNMFQMTCSMTTVPTLTMYADDHQLYADGETRGTVESGLKTQGHFASSWYKNNSLLSNPEKFQSLTVNPRNIEAENTTIELWTLTESWHQKNRANKFTRSLHWRESQLCGSF